MAQVQEDFEVTYDITLERDKKKEENNSSSRPQPPKGPTMLRRRQNTFHVSPKSGNAIKAGHYSNLRRHGSSGNLDSSNCLSSDTSFMQDLNSVSSSYSSTTNSSRSPVRSRKHKQGFFAKQQQVNNNNNHHIMRKKKQIKTNQARRSKDRNIDYSRFVDPPAKSNKQKNFSNHCPRISGLPRFDSKLSSGSSWDDSSIDRYTTSYFSHKNLPRELLYNDYVSANFSTTHNYYPGMNGMNGFGSRTSSYRSRAMMSSLMNLPIQEETRSLLFRDLQNSEKNFNSDQRKNKILRYLDLLESEIDRARLELHRGPIEDDNNNNNINCSNSNHLNLTSDDSFSFDNMDKLDSFEFALQQRQRGNTKSPQKQIEEKPKLRTIGIGQSYKSNQNGYQMSRNAQNYVPDDSTNATSSDLDSICIANKFKIHKENKKNLVSTDSAVDVEGEKQQSNQYKISDQKGQDFKIRDSAGRFSLIPGSKVQENIEKVVEPAPVELPANNNSNRDSNNSSPIPPIPRVISLDEYLTDNGPRFKPKMMPPVLAEVTDQDHENQSKSSLMSKNNNNDNNSNTSSKKQLNTSRNSYKLANIDESSYAGLITDFSRLQSLDGLSGVLGAINSIAANGPSGMNLPNGVVQNFHNEGYQNRTLESVFRKSFSKQQLEKLEVGQCLSEDMVSQEKLEKGNSKNSNDEENNSVGSNRDSKKSVQFNEVMNVKLIDKNDKQKKLLSLTNKVCDLKSNSKKSLGKSDSLPVGLEKNEKINGKSEGETPIRKTDLRRAQSKIESSIKRHSSARILKSKHFNLTQTCSSSGSGGGDNNNNNNNNPRIRIPENRSRTNLKPLKGMKMQTANLCGGGNEHHQITEELIAENIQLVEPLESVLPVSKLLTKTSHSQRIPKLSARTRPHTQLKQALSFNTATTRNFNLTPNRRTTQIEDSTINRLNLGMEGSNNKNNKSLRMANCGSVNVGKISTTENDLTTTVTGLVRNKSSIAGIVRKVKKIF